MKKSNVIDRIVATLFTKSPSLTTSRRRSTGAASGLPRLKRFLTGAALTAALLVGANANAENSVVTWTGAQSNVWNLTDANWSDSSDGTFLDGDYVIFTDLAGTPAPQTIMLGGTGKTVARMDVTGTGNWTFIGDILGDGSSSTLTGENADGTLRVTTTGTVNFEGKNRFEGRILLDTGTMNIGAGSELNSGRYIDVGESGSGVLNLSDGGNPHRRRIGKHFSNG